jgi:hypothetical protein
MDEVPPLALAGLADLDRAISSAEIVEPAAAQGHSVLINQSGVALSLTPGSEIRTAPAPDARALAERWRVVKQSKQEICAQYHDLLHASHRRAYLPAMPAEAQWAQSRHPHLAKSDGITFAAEIDAELDRWEITDCDCRREQAGYFEAIDMGRLQYKSQVEGELRDERLKASRR